MSIVIPLKAVPSQTLQVLLNGQSCIIDVYQTDYGLYMDLYLGSQLVVAGVTCLNLNRIVRSLYLGFSGDLAFFDTQAGGGEGADPVYTGLGSQFVLLYFSAAELGGAG